jgi:hypothetical protein
MENLLLRNAYLHLDVDREGRVGPAADAYNVGAHVDLLLATLAELIQLPFVQIDDKRLGRVSRGLDDVALEFNKSLLLIVCEIILRNNLGKIFTSLLGEYLDCAPLLIGGRLHAFSLGPSVAEPGEESGQPAFWGRGGVLA